MPATLVSRTGPPLAGLAVEATYHSPPLLMTFTSLAPFREAIFCDMGALAEMQRLRSGQPPPPLAAPAPPLRASVTNVTDDPLL